MNIDNYIGELVKSVIFGRVRTESAVMMATTRTLPRPGEGASWTSILAEGIIDLEELVRSELGIFLSITFFSPRPRKWGRDFAGKVQ